MEESNLRHMVPDHGCGHYTNPTLAVKTKTPLGASPGGVGTTLVIVRVLAHTRAE